MKTQEIVSAIYNVQTMDELRQVYDAFKTRSKELNTRLALVFREGEKVEFKGRHQMTVRGVVTKVNAKSIAVKAETGVNWKVSPSLLKKIV